MNDKKQIQLLKDAIDAYENGEILEAKDMVIEFINNITNFEIESDDRGCDEDIINFIKENYAPVEDKPGYVWFNKRNFQIISIETLAKALEDQEQYHIRKAVRNDKRRKV